MVAFHLKYWLKLTHPFKKGPHPHRSLLVTQHVTSVIGHRHTAVHL